MQGTRISDKTFALVKQMLNQGYSPKKVVQMLPDEIKVAVNTIRKIGNADTYDEYCGIKPEPKEPEKVVAITPFSQTKDVIDAIERTNVRLDSIFQLLKELVESLS